MQAEGAERFWVCRLDISQSAAGFTCTKLNMQRLGSSLTCIKLMSRLNYMYISHFSADWQHTCSCEWERPWWLCQPFWCRVELSFLSSVMFCCWLSTCQSIFFPPFPPLMQTEAGCFSLFCVVTFALISFVIFSLYCFIWYTLIYVCLYSEISLLCLCFHLLLSHYIFSNDCYHHYPCICTFSMSHTSCLLSKEQQETKTVHHHQAGFLCKLIFFL